MEFCNILLNEWYPKIFFYLAGRLIGVIIPRREPYHSYQKEKRILWAKTAEAARSRIFSSRTIKRIIFRRLFTDSLVVLSHRFLYLLDLTECYAVVRHTLYYIYCNK